MSQKNHSHNLVRHPGPHFTTTAGVQVLLTTTTELSILILSANYARD